MSEALDWVGVFFQRFGRLDPAWLALGVLLHVSSLTARTRAWRNIIAAAVGRPTPWRGVFGAYVAGIGLNALTPARGGDLVKLFLAKRTVERATYPTLVSTLVVETLFDFVAGSAIVLWAVQLGVVHRSDLLPRIDWGWLGRHPFAAIGIGAILAGGALFVALLAWTQVRTFASRLRRGFAVLGDPGYYLRAVVSWQAADWLLRLASAWAFLSAFGLGGGPRAVLFVQVARSVATLLPFTPGGVGTKQALYVLVLAGQAPTGTLLAFGISMNLALEAANVFLGLLALALMLRTLRWRKTIEAEPELRGPGANGSAGRPRPGYDAKLEGGSVRRFGRSQSSRLLSE